MEKTSGCDVTSRQGKTDTVEAMWKVILSECYSTMEKTFGRDVKSPQGTADTVEAMWLTGRKILCMRTDGK
ncbi:hypothetical protein T01_8735 [Trichinella spiralis]|uniref:Uncharacterized protein n=1 Tax=Trichinella spiralis TaxID=6334 RepID=A0A0V0YXB8_TRISP|nr:hypothetical protein T01_8735 [Trichinella spiralis]